MPYLPMTIMMRLRTTLLCVAAVVGIGSTSALVSAVGADDTLNSPAGAVQRAERLEPPVDMFPDRPRVFMAFHGTNRLANDTGLDSQWRYVQDNLDGFWGNNANISADEIARFVNKVDTRQLAGESDFQGSSFFVQTYDYIEQFDPSIDFERESITFYTSQPSRWDGNTIAAARSAVDSDRRNGAGDDKFTSVFTGWQPQNLYTDFVRQYPPIPAGSSAERALFDGDGIFVECPTDVCNGVEYEDGFFRAMRIARETDQRFVWLASHLPNQPQAGWLREFQTMYNRVSAEGLWRPGDIVALIAYGGLYPVVPERDGNGNAADTLTGIAYWALKQ